MEILESLKGLNVIDTHYDNAGFGILFDDGIVLYVTDEGYVFSYGTGWVEFWEELKS